MSSWSFHLFAAVLTTTQQLVAAAADPCDVSMTDATLHTAPVVVDGCPTPFDDEQALLDASTRCAARTSSGGSVCHSMRRGWWAAARALTPLVDDRGRTSVRQHAEGLRAGAASVNLEVLRGGSSKASGLSGEGLNVVTPACQWAQNSTVAAVAVRFSPKRYGPVSVANVDNAHVHLNETHLEFRALARGKPIQFHLLLAFHAPVDMQASTYEIERGRLEVHLVKAKVEVWPDLAGPAAEGQRRGPIAKWYERQEHLGSHWASKDSDDE